MGLLITEVMSGTSYTLSELYKLPIYTLYAIHRNLGRIDAASKLRFISAVNAAIWGNESLTDGLVESAGNIFEEYADSSDEYRTHEERQHRRAIKRLRSALGGK